MRPPKSIAFFRKDLKVNGFRAKFEPHRALCYVPFHMRKVAFNVRHAQSLVRLYCKLTGIRRRPIVRWNSFGTEIGARCLATYLKRYGHTVIEMNRVHWNHYRKVIASRNRYMWGMFGHEMAHIVQPNHQKMKFGLELLRVQDFFENYVRSLK